MSRDVNPFGLRMPPEVKEELEKLAEQIRSRKTSDEIGYLRIFADASGYRNMSGLVVIWSISA